MDGFCEEEFNKNILEIFNLSELLSDNFQIHQIHSSKFYLAKKQKITLKVAENEEIDEDKSVAVQEQVEIYSLEYHILFHRSYSVPCLYFNASKSGGQQVSIQEVKNLFVDSYENRDCKDDILNMISQGEHPILMRPFFFIHPCKINQVLAKFPESKNRVLTFISLYGPSVHLKLNNDYAKFFL